jgi:hypothetical protein
MALTERYKKSTRSGDNGSCVEVALRGRVEVRDSKDRQGPVLGFSEAAWTAFIEDLRADTV